MCDGPVTTLRQLLRFLPLSVARSTSLNRLIHQRLLQATFIAGVIVAGLVIWANGAVGIF
jgi:uncharacterized membrane protein